MTTRADRTIAALRSIHDDLARLVPTLSGDQLNGPSGASEWSVAQVLSHLGSGAEIGQAGYRAAIDGTAPPEQDFNKGVWDRWNAMSPADQAAGFLRADADLVATLEALSPEQREGTQMKLGFLPAPIPLAAAAGMRLGEAAQHAWDVKVALDPGATVDAAAADVMLEHYSDGLGFLLGFTGKADRLATPAVVALEGTDLALIIDDSVHLGAGADPTATFTGASESVIRLLGGRLTAPYTPTGVQVTGNVTLEDLREVFPGY
ncbi:maleylpyruvate isomerase N-terminal domain-containing protein [Nocardioides sp.]|uniref:maleylpyruvate isomerase N-terminal domain-containing protein n=1 Tax=Nocardioides sp. TaxID=35761 RepID=UPI003D0A557A